MTPELVSLKPGVYTPRSGDTTGVCARQGPAAPKKKSMPIAVAHNPAGKTDLREFIFMLLPSGISLNHRARAKCHLPLALNRHLQSCSVLLTVRVTRARLIPSFVEFHCSIWASIFAFAA